MKNEKVIDLLAIDAENLKAKQFDALKQHGINVLSEVLELLRKNDFKKIREMTFYSPAGDGMGTDSNCIDFDWTGTGDDTDITGYLDTLEGLMPKKK